MESLVHPKKSFLCSSIRLLPSECLESNLLVPFPVATSDSLHSLTHAFLPVFCHTFNSDANSDYNFFHSLSPSYLRPFLVLLPKPLSSGSKSNIILQPTRKLALPQKGEERKRRGLCFARKLRRNNIRNQLCERGTKSTRRERGRRESTDCSSIN